ELALNAESVCIVDILQIQKCNCDITKSPYKGNSTDAVKYVYTRIFTPNWTVDQTAFIHDKVSKYNYAVDLKEAFNFLLCSRCNSGLLKLVSTKKKLLSNSVKNMNKKASKKIKLEPEICDLTIAEEKSFYDS
ncbi:16209_t:CDS:1, partial [Dentiscutata erythropus]